MHIRDYIHATYQTLEKGSDTERVMKNLKTYLEKRGLLKLHPRILRGLIEKIRKSERSLIPRVILARVQDEKNYKKEIGEALEKIGGAKEYEIQVDESIIGGFIVKGKNERADASYKRTLLHAYHRLTD